MIFIDTHAHIDDEQFEGERQAVIRRAEDAGVKKIINMSVSLANAQRVLQIASAEEIVFAGVGVHPEEIDGFDFHHIDELAHLTENEKVVAIGEIGLDYHFRDDNKEEQRKIFIAQLDLARQLHLPVSIHARDAHGDLMAILRREGKGVQGSIHCYSGSVEMAKELLHMGWFIGIDGPLTFKNAAKLPDVVKMLPLERLLLETDCPYLAPVPMRGKKNEPAFLPYIAAKIAEIKEIAPEEVALKTTENAEHLFFDKKL